MLYAYDKHSNGRIMHKFSYQLSNDLSLEKNNKKDNKFGLLDRNIVVLQRLEDSLVERKEALLFLG